MGIRGDSDMNLYSVVIYFLSSPGEITYIASIDNLTSLREAQELEDLYNTGKCVSAYIDGYISCKWI